MQIEQNPGNHSTKSVFEIIVFAKAVRFSSSFLSFFLSLWGLCFLICGVGLLEDRVQVTGFVPYSSQLYTSCESRLMNNIALQRFL